MISIKSHSLEIINCLNSRKRSNLSEKTLTCKVCNKIFYNSYKFKLHKKFHTGDNSQKRNIFSKPLKVKTDLITRVKIYSGETRKYTCDVCQRAFKVKTDLARHVMIHTGEKPFKCNVCPKAFIRSTDRS